MRNLLLDLSAPKFAVRLFECTSSLWLIFNSIKFFGVSKFLVDKSDLCESRVLDIPFHIESVFARLLGFGIAHLVLGQIFFSILMFFGGSSWLLRSINFILFLNLTNYCILTTDGGMDLLQNILFIFIFCERTDKKLNAVRSNYFHTALASFVIKFQISAVYLVAAFSKIVEKEDTWRQGTALYYILQVRGYSNPFFSDFILNHDFLITIGSLSAIVFQVAFGCLSFNRRLKFFALFPMALIHLGIAATIGLVSFGFMMISLYPIFLHQEDIHSFRKMIHFLYRIIDEKFGITSGQNHSSV